MTSRARTRRPLRLTAALLTTLITAVGWITVATPEASAAARTVAVRAVSPSESVIEVYSPAMNRVITNRVLHRPGTPPAPTVYMLPGLGGGEDGISWLDNTNVRGFFAGKRVNAVFPIGGRSSMFTDWNADDPILGRNKWQTYLTRELPPLINRAFSGTGSNAITGVSMSAGPALALAQAAPQLYRAVAAYSGCPGTMSPLGLGATAAVVTRGGGNVLNMWGPPGSPGWMAHDPIAGAPRLHGKAIYLSAASGVPGSIDGGARETLGGLAGGSQIEAYARECTAAMSARLHSLGIAHVFRDRAQGSHSWGLFAAELRDSWPMIGAAIGA